jgi:hypothetical protein
VDIDTVYDGINRFRHLYVSLYLYPKDIHPGEGINLEYSDNGGPWTKAKSWIFGTGPDTNDVAYFSNTEGSNSVFGLIPLDASESVVSLRLIAFGSRGLQMYLDTVQIHGVFSDESSIGI